MVDHSRVTPVPLRPPTSRTTMKTTRTVCITSPWMRTRLGGAPFPKSMLIHFLTRVCVFIVRRVDPLWSRNAIWWHRHCCLIAPSHHLNQSWLVFNWFCDIHMRAISTCKMSLMIMFLKFLPHMPGVNEETYWGLTFLRWIYICFMFIRRGRQTWDGMILT